MDTNPVSQGPTLLTSLNLNSFPQTQPMGLELQHRNFLRKTQFSPWKTVISHNQGGETGRRLRQKVRPPCISSESACCLSGLLATLPASSQVVRAALIPRLQPLLHHPPTFFVCCSFAICHVPSVLPAPASTSRQQVRVSVACPCTCGFCIWSMCAYVFTCV